MLTQREEKFISWWQQNRDKQKKGMRQLLIGLPMGLLLGGGILLSLGTGWYKRANMVANSQFNPNVLTIAILAIAVFMAVFYKKYKWDQYEQQYRELMAKKQAREKTADAAHEVPTQSEQ